MNVYLQKNCFKLVIIISLIGLFFILGVFYFDAHQKITRDQKRLQDIRDIQIAIDKYYEKHGNYPDAGQDACCDRWDIGFCKKDGNDGFLSVLVKEGFLDQDRGDPLFFGHCQGYFYHHYNCNNNSPYYPCYGCDKPFYVLAIRKLETEKVRWTNRAISPTGFKCPTRDWGQEFDYVVGKFEE
ncbi:hypothetical protein KKD19_07030 [Patescibacteria group bacterium]|nr:hypothetical protein [Patescibacteria group bacterium]MBU4512958.1 hypothetical protein [Patescibacteria group bacterium]MCG2692994.1 hypothetical protein [Candidatus Parcubacteria bacterium]